MVLLSLVVVSFLFFMYSRVILKQTKKKDITCTCDTLDFFASCSTFVFSFYCLTSVRGQVTSDHQSRHKLN